MFAEGFLGSENAEGRAVASRGAVVPAPHLKPVPPHFTFGPLVATYIQYCILKMWPPFWFFLPCRKILATGLADGAKKLLQKRHLAYPSPSAKLKSINSNSLSQKPRKCIVLYPS